MCNKIIITPFQGLCQESQPSQADRYYNGYSEDMNLLHARAMEQLRKEWNANG